MPEEKIRDLEHKHEGLDHRVTDLERKHDVHLETHKGLSGTISRIIGRVESLEINWTWIIRTAAGGILAGLIAYIVKEGSQ